MATSREQIEAVFPGLTGSGYQITSPIDFGYNCIAWAAGCTHKFWWPGGFWIKGVPEEVNLVAFKILFERIGYEICGSSDMENGYEKIAIFKNALGEPSHAARQQLSGEWTSKLGRIEDIKHTQDGLNGDKYGVIAFFMRRKVKRIASCVCIQK